MSKATGSTVGAHSANLRRMPRTIPRNVKARVVDLIAQDKDSPEIIATIAAEFEGQSVSRNTISSLRSKLDMPSKAGRREGSPHAVMVAELCLYAEPALSLRDMAVIAGLSPEGVRRLVPDEK